MDDEDDDCDDLRKLQQQQLWRNRLWDKKSPSK
jgi:hypothetical protein